MTRSERRAKSRQSNLTLAIKTEFHCSSRAGFLSQAELTPIVSARSSVLLCRTFDALLRIANALSGGRAPHAVLCARTLRKSNMLRETPDDESILRVA